MSLARLLQNQLPLPTGQAGQALVSQGDGQPTIWSNFISNLGAPNGVQLLSATGSAGNVLMTYDVRPLTGNAAGPFALQNISPGLAVKIGQIVTLTFPSFQPNGNGTNSTISVQTTLPNQFNPSSPVQVPIICVSNAQGFFGTALFNTSGSIVIANGPNVGNGAFNTSNAVGWNPFTVSYTSSTP